MPPDKYSELRETLLIQHKKSSVSDIAILHLLHYAFSLTVKFGHGVIDDALLGVGVLDGGVIVGDKVALENKP